MAEQRAISGSSPGKRCDMNAADSLAIEEIAAAEESFAVVLRQQVLGLPPTLLRWHPEEGAWCIQQIIGHLVQREQAGFSARIRSILREHDPRLVSLDQNQQEAEARYRRDCEADPSKLCEEFAGVRAESVRLIRSLGGGDLQSGGLHLDVGYLSVRDLLNEWIYHDQDHLRQISANVQKYVWPYLGATRSFYERS